MTLPEFRATHCTRYRYRYSECRRCADACPHGAVELSGEGVAISSTLCQHCALCTAACPTEALVTPDMPRVELLRRVTKLPAVTFACAPSGRKGDEIVPCLGALDAASLAFLAARGIAVVLAGTGHCAECPHGSKGAAMIARHLDATEALRRAIGNDKWTGAAVADDDGAPPGDHNAARRQLFRRLIGTRGAAGPAAAHPVPLKAVRFAPPIATAGRELLQILLEQRETSKPEPPAEAPPPLARHDAIFAARIETAPGCTACEVCARACPTAAIEVRESGTAWELTFRQSRCTGCGLCVEACQPGVLGFADDLGSTPAAKMPVTLHALSKQRCGRCDRFFISAAPAENCQICEGDDADFAAIFG
jgi:formate hydrogenlyase subunit 6/NADH:ubiquinone oxidoreductase subunit I